jgi:futalosine hydrolase
VILVVAATADELAGAESAETMVCGIGPIDAAAATAQVLAERRPDALLHVGLAGARGLRSATLVIGAAAVYEDARSALVARRIEPDPQLLAAARRALPDAALLPIGTSARVGGTNECRVEAMEGFAVLRAASLAGVPAVEVRAVSNEVDEPDRARWHFEAALAALATAVPRVLMELK